MKRYPKYKASGYPWFGDVPEDWAVKDLKHELKFQTGGTPSTKERRYYGGEHIWVTIGDMDGKFASESSQQITDEGIKAANIPLTPKGSLLYSFKLSVGQVAFALKDLYTNEAIASFLPSSKYDIDFWYYSLPFSVIHNAEENIYGAKLLNQELIKNAGLIVPSKDEQKHIVKYLDFKTGLIDNFISNRQKQIDLLKAQLRKKIYTALTKGLSNTDFKPSDLPWFTEIPENWEMYKFNAAIKLLHGFQFRDNHFKEQGVKVAKITQLKADGSLDLSEASLVDEKFLFTLKKKIIKNGDILMALTGGTIGKIIQVENLEEEVLQNYRVGKFVPKDTRTLDKDFMFWVLSSEFTFAQILFLQRETGQPNIGIGDFSKMFFPMPNTLEEQREIALYIVEQKNETNSLISKYQKQIDLMQEYRTAIISQAVTGKIDVRDWQPKTKEIIS
jgi:type I restriction enzyme S subunit